MKSVAEEQFIIEKTLGDSNVYFQRKSELVPVQIDEYCSKEIKMKAYLEEVKKADNYLPEWSNDVWMLMVKKAIVNRDKTITFKFTSGTEVTL